MNSKKKPNIPAFLLWEYYLEIFNYDKSYKIVIERVLQMGTINDWKEIINFYYNEKILETIEWSAQLDKRDKDFSKFFLKSDMLYVV
ncbi:MAG: hypothetical protein H7174_04570 [Flavobacterium sp.]|nr:hypothetical protein [Flavobacterium sp.]